MNRLVPAVPAATGSRASTARPLPRSFYEQPVLDLAHGLVGNVLVTSRSEGTTAGRIVECEAYRGPEDLAAHSAGGRRTARTEAMFGRAGHAYMFLLYGMHWAFNIVAAREGEPHAVLVRAIEPLRGVELMALRRRMSAERRELTNGPGKLTAALALGRADYGADLCAATSGVFLIAGAPRGPIARARRINIDYAGRWAEKPWRFYERDSPYVSVRPRPRR